MSETNRKLRNERALASVIAENLADRSEENYLTMVIRRFSKHKMAVIGMLIVLFLAICAILAQVISPYDPYQISDNFSAAPSAQHLLGTDQVGRDVLSRLIYGARVSLTVGLGTVAISVIIGTVLGLVSGYLGGKTDMIIMRITDMFMSFPDIVIILVVVSIMGPGLKNIIIVIGLLRWPGVTRLVRGNVLSIKKMDYVKSAVALGLKTPRILFIHILPITLAPVLVNATSGMASAIITEASLSFLGMGVQPPMSSWGNMITDAQSISVLTSQPWLWLPPGTLIVLCVLSINFIGDGLRDALDPKNLK
ncbi:ABC-type dipeptide/oligopeptide/nickel transport system, permease component [Desulfosporosinus orientis DSM 765]|uniref:ABC-type dipeptide/oligopeptide/nickel transport system, permease component n=1 Tax=Desulfosporosinus orientis (strain ATCC 19365 / DSM 765 / NCIMB 8382 / VKM B-1628 / Singapore I) TaxID=768706 RepID=G7WDA4_DESOD|nr:oligopeptide ABC transporter permease [Desulfosporosinus orientis]AET67589.1 ABC-type dipeptide/oligopeptide/nickel transport system, permease component [Desulfosporosinus orientis DSM 765]